MPLHTFEVKVTFDNLAIDLTPFMAQYPISLKSCDPSLFLLYDALVDYMNVIEALGLLNTYISPLPLKFFFGRHVTSWIEVAYVKEINELIPNMIKRETWEPLNEDVKHAQSCVDLAWVINNVRSYIQTCQMCICVLTVSLLLCMSCAYIIDGVAIQ